MKIDEKSVKNLSCVADAFLERLGAAVGCQMLDFGSQNVQNISKMATKIYPKSMRNRGCVADAFLDRLAAPNGSRPGCFWEPFGDNFQ